MSLPILPTYIPVAEAAEKYGYDLDELKKMARSGKINAAVLPDGDMVVSDDSIKAKILKKEDLPEYKKFADLADETIWVSKAAREYDIAHQTISGWIKSGYIRKMGMQGNKRLLNAQDMAYCAEVYKFRKGQGKRIFVQDGMPCTPKTGPLSPDTVSKQSEMEPEPDEKQEVGPTQKQMPVAA